MRTSPSLLLLLVTFCLACHPVQLAAAETALRSVGVRGGFSEPAHDDLRQYDALAVFRLPWELRSRSGWGVSTQAGLSAGMLSGRGEQGFIGTLGPAFGLGRPGFPLELDFGVSLAILSRDTFGSQDYNGISQFVSHAGLRLRLDKKIGLAYRFQHMSNAGFNGERNPGLNLHMFGIDWYFAD